VAVGVAGFDGSEWLPGGSRWFFCGAKATRNKKAGTPPSAGLIVAARDLPIQPPRRSPRSKPATTF